MADSDWDSEPEEQPAVPKKPNGVIQQGDKVADRPYEERRDGRRSGGSHRPAAGGELGQRPAGGGAAPPAGSPKGSSHRQQKHRQRQQEQRQPEQRQQEQRQRQPEREQEEQPPFSFRSETDDGQRVSRHRPRPPGRQQRSEYTVSADQAAHPSPTPADTARDSLLRCAAILSPCPRPRSAQPLPLLHTEQTAVLRDSFWRGDSVIRDAAPLLARPAPPVLSPRHAVDLKKMSPPGSVRRNSPGPEPPTPLVREPLTNSGPVVQLDGPQSGPETGPLVEEPGEEGEAGALALSATTYHFSQPDLRELKTGDQNPSRLLGRYGRVSYRQLMRMWSEVFWVISVPILLITTFLFSLLRFVLESVVRPFTLGPLQLLGDQLLKPAAVAVHDSLLLPAATLLANSLTALALVGRPLAQLLDVLVRPLATLLASCRLVHISYGQQTVPAALVKTDGAHQV